MQTIRNNTAIKLLLLDNFIFPPCDNFLVQPSFSTHADGI